MPAAARADTYCVNTTGCDHDNGNPSLQQALDDAKNHAGPDSVKLGSAPLSTATGFTYVGVDPVAIQGAGGRAGDSAGSVLSDSSSNPSSHTVLSVRGSTASTISGITVVVPGGTGASNTGIDTEGAISNVLVHGTDQPTNIATGVALESGGSLTDSDVLLPTGLSATAVAMAGTGTLVQDSRLHGTEGFANRGVSVSGVVRRAQISFSDAGIAVQRGDARVEDVVLLADTTKSNPPPALSVNAFASDVSIDVDHATIIGGGTKGSSASFVSGSGGNRGDLTVRNSVISGYESAFNRIASSGGTANVSADYSDYRGGAANDTGPGAITQTNRLDADPGFLGNGDYHLAPGSPLVDAGDPAGLASGESATDASGQARIADGDGNCVARRDIGAFEFQPGPRAPRAAATAAPGTATIGQPVTFDASSSCDPDGDALTYAWAFDQGPPATGVSHMRGFTTAGLHFATVTVTDSTGRSTTATATVVVTKPVLPPFAGVAIPSGQKVKVSRQRIAAVRVSCPAGTVGACGGTLTLTRAGGHKLGAASFAVARGVSRKVSVKLSASAFKSLRKSKRQNATAVSVAHDANGTTKRTTRVVKLVAPH